MYCFNFCSVIAIDIDPNKIKFARRNAEIYGVADKIEFIIGDFFKVSSMLKADVIDVIFMSPPWGGPEYVVNNSFSLESMCKDLSAYGGFSIFNIVKKLSSNIALHIPKTTNIYGVSYRSNFVYNYFSCVMCSLLFSSVYG